MVLNSVAITGARGMVGRHIVSALEIAGIPVFPFFRKTDPERQIPDVRVWDQTQWQTHPNLDSLFKGVGAIVHAGAMVPRGGDPFDESAMFDANVKACLNLGEWAMNRSIPIVYISGAVVYANSDRDELDETVPTAYTGAGGFYGLTKLLAEDIFLRLKQRGLLLSLVRPSSVYGTGLASTKTINAFLSTASKGGSIEVTPPVDDKVDLIHAADVAHAVVRILKAKAWDTFNLSSGKPASILEIANACISVAKKGNVHILDATQEVRLPTRRFCLNYAHAQQELGWTPQIGLEQGISAMLENRILTIC